ncbi:MAG: pilus assembly protein TadG-related protein [Bdellovibrionota bacterium]
MNLGHGRLESQNLAHEKGPGRRHGGQISVLMVLSLIPMFTLFAFVVNIGMLVNAKISLQNAADFAAYAGAATQARQLTHISHLNYQMRQAYKKFLFRYYVMGNLSLRCFPREAGQPPAPGCNTNGVADIPFVWENPSGSNAPGFPGVPVVCIALSTDSNPCQLARAVPIVTRPPCISADPTCQALINASTAIADIQRTSCRANSAINVEVLTHWLYATDNQLQLQSNTNLQGLIDDIGLVTEELLLRSRIKTIEAYINAPPQARLSTVQARRLEEAVDQATTERTILAYKSAIGNLNERVFDLDSVEMSELLPSQPLLELREIRPRIDTGYAFMDGDDPSAPGGCDMKAEFIQSNPIVGVAKKPNSYVYYAVKLTAQARLLFNPFPFGNPDESIELTAYSAAAPFGSRIGPDISESDFVRQGTPSINGVNQTPVNYPWLQLGKDLSWEHSQVLRAFRSLLRGDGSNGSVAGGAVGKQDLDRGLRAAMFPEENEIGQYNIPVDTDTINSDEAHEMIPYYRNNPGEHYTFWAPLMPIGGTDEFTQRMRGELEQVVFSLTAAGNVTTQVKQVLVDRFNTQLQTYLGRLPSERNFNIARIPDPLSQRFWGNNPIPGIPGKIAGPAESVGPRIASSFTTSHDRTYYENGRDGYSVKFIPFKMLVAAPGQLTPAANWPVVNGNFGGDIEDLRLLAH